MGAEKARWWGINPSHTEFEHQWAVGASLIMRRRQIQQSKTEVTVAHLFLKFSALSGLLAVALGAFGAHALKNRLDEYAQGVYQTAVLYQFVHTLALLACALLMLFASKSQALTVAGMAFMLGIVIFSGSLYGLSLSGVRILGAITPIGGLAFIIGWAALFIAAFQLS